MTARWGEGPDESGYGATARAETSGGIYPTAYQTMQIFDSPLILIAIFLAGCLLLYVTRNHHPTVTAALIIIVVVLCVTIVGAAMVGANDP